MSPVRPAARALIALIALIALCAPAILMAEDEHESLSRYCFSCHSVTKHKGDFDLESLGRPGASPQQADGWEKAREAISAGDMPPEGKPQPSFAERERLAAWIDAALDGPDGSEPKDPGWVTIHRLTRHEFNRTIHDLLGVDGDPAEAFPADSSGGSGGFDNNADGLFVSPMLLERLLDAALAVVERAKGERLLEVKPDKDTPQARRKAVELSLTAFLPHAWRRPVSASEVQALARIYDRCIKRNNVTHEDALHLAYAAALTSPNFLFRVEESHAAKDPWPLSDFALASRLSYFLWSSMPDEELMASAKAGKLTQPAELAGQAARMLKDPRARFFVAQFTGQWLGTAELSQGHGPDPKLFPAYDDALRAAMVEEPVAFMSALIADNRSLLDLIDCDYVYVNATLARHYELSAPSGDGFQRVQLADGRRGGVVAMAGVLATTSRPSRTSPVIRGKWILQDLLSTPPPPPPPMVPPLPEATGDLAKMSLRSRLERHRADPSCNSCHQRIDPLGFGLENFDALGRWRDHGDQGEALDTIGTLPSGETFSGPQELKKLLLKRKERIITTVCERMLSYALGRGIERYDRPTIRRMVKDLAAEGYKAQTLIAEVVTSLPFRMRRNPALAVASAPAAPDHAKPPPAQVAKP